MRIYTKYLLLLCTVFFLNMYSSAEVRLPHVFGDHMVLQRETMVKVWGWAEPGEKVAVTPSWNQKVATTAANGNGNWSIELSTPKAGGPMKYLFKAVIRFY